MRERDEVRFSEIDHVDIVAHARAVRGCPVVAEDRDVRSLAERRFEARSG